MDDFQEGLFHKGGVNERPTGPPPASPPPAQETVSCDNCDRLQSKVKRLTAEIQMRDDRISDDAAHLSAYRMEIERLTAELADWHAAAAKAASEDCDGEKHCACVPLLRREVERLRPYYDAVRAAHNGYNQPASRDDMGMDEPASPAEAIRELVQEAEDMSGTEIVTLRAEVERLEKELAVMTADRDDMIKQDHENMAEAAEQIKRLEKERNKWQAAYQKQRVEIGRQSRDIFTLEEIVNGGDEQIKRLRGLLFRVWEHFYVKTHDANGLPCETCQELGIWIRALSAGDGEG